MNALHESFRSYIQEQQLFAVDDRLLIAVSGGLDSVVLCHLCVALGYDIVLAHCNFQLRGVESERDEAFVRSLAADLQRPLFVQKMDTAAYAQQHKRSIQVAARELRYQWFDTLVAEQNLSAEKPIRWILTAHHADDAIETAVMHFFRGTGIAGLRGIPPANGRIRRPLLFAFRDQLQAYADAHHLHWVEDSSNQTDYYTRNALRHQLLPIVAQLFPQYRQQMKEQLERFTETAAIFQSAIEVFRTRWVVQEGAQWKIPVKVLQRTPHVKTYLFELLKVHGFSAAQMDDVLHLLEAATGRHVAASQWQVVRHRDWLVVAPLLNPDGVQLINTVPSTVQTAQHTLTFQYTQVDQIFMKAHPSDAFLDKASLQFPLLLRPWKPGDYFYPMGMRKKKKIARFLIDQKLSKPDKEAVLVLESAGKIVWVVGHRIDDRFKCMDDRKEVLWIKN